MEDRDTERLVTALVAAFPAYLEGRLAYLGVAVDATLAEVLRDASQRLRADLEDTLGRPPAEQWGSPLEMVRRATAPVTAALSAMGVAAADRDAWEVETHPDDRYGLFPTTSQELGEEVWRLHLQWGMTKAEAVAGVVPARREPVAFPAVALFGVPIEQRDRLRAEIERRDFGVLLWRNPAALEDAATAPPVLVLVHLAHPAAHQAIRALAADNIRVVAVAERVDDLTTPGIMALGAEEVVASAGLVARLDRLLPRRA